MQFKLNYDVCDGVEKLEKEIERVRKAQQKFATYSQEQVDKIFHLQTKRGYLLPNLP